METAQDRWCKKEIEALKRICGSFRIDTLKPRIAALEEVSQETGVINVALLGRFKAGKSSFLNSIIGEDILPVGVLPLTAAVTRVRYGPNDKAEVSLLSGQAKNIGLAELADFITEERNPENVKKISRVDLELSRLERYPGVQFVDTPGLGSVHQHNTATSRGWLPRVGAAFLAISIDHPLSEDDITLLRELESHTPETHIILTKIDLVTFEEVHKVVSFIETQIQKKLGKSLRVFPFSNKPGFEASRKAVYEFIHSISEDHLKKSKEIINHKLHSVASTCFEYLKLAVSAAASNEESRQLLRRQILQERENVSAIKNELRVIGDNIKVRLRTESYEKFMTQFPELRSQLIEELAEEMHGWKGNTDNTSRAFWHWLRATLAKHLEDVLGELGPQVSMSYLDEALSGFSRTACAFQDRIAEDIEKALHTKFNNASFEARIEKPNELDIHLYELTMSLTPLLLAIIPTDWIRPLLKRRFISQINVEVEKNLTRLSHQWVDAVSSAIDHMAGETLAFIRDEIATVENLLNESIDRRPEIEQSMRQLNAIAAGESL